MERVSVCLDVWPLSLSLSQKAGWVAVAVVWRRRLSPPRVGPYVQERLYWERRGKREATPSCCRIALPDFLSRSSTERTEGGGGETPNNRPPTRGPPPFVGIERAFQRKKGEGGVLRSLLSRPRRRRRPLMSVCLASEGDGSKKKNDRRGREGGLLHGGRRPRASGLSEAVSRPPPTERGRPLSYYCPSPSFIHRGGGTDWRRGIEGGIGGPFSFLCWLSPQR